MMPPTPSISIIIPAYFSYLTLEACLASLRLQTFQDFEVILVNSSPEEHTRALVTTHFPEVMFVQSPVRLLPHAARNRGVEQAHGPFLVFTDPDCTFPPTWLSFLLRAYEEGHSAVGGSMGLQKATWFEKGIHLCKFHPVLPGRSPGLLWIAPTANAGYTREAWDDAGPFDADLFCGDALLSWRAAAHGHRPWFVPEAVVLHHHGDTLSSFWRQRRKRGREFAAARAAFERWSRLRLLAYLMLMPALPLAVLVLAGRHALLSGWTLQYLSTLPLQLLGHVAWSLGEGQAHWSALTHRPRLGEGKP